MINSNYNTYNELVNALKDVGESIKNEKNGKQLGHLYIQINPKTHELISSPSSTKTNIASFKEISQLVKEALSSKDITLNQKKEMLEGYAQIINKYNEKKNTLIEKIGNFFTKIISYKWGQASEVDKADNLINTYLPQYRVILEKTSPEAEQEIKKQISEMTERKQIEEKDIPKLLTEAKKMNTAAFTARVLVQEIEERIIRILFKIGKISEATKEKITTQQRGKPYSFEYLTPLILEGMHQNPELTEIFKEYKMKVESAAKYTSLAKNSSQDLENKQNIINELNNKINTKENELGLLHLLIN